MQPEQSMTPALRRSSEFSDMLENMKQHLKHCIYNEKKKALILLLLYYIWIEMLAVPPILVTFYVEGLIASLPGVSKRIILK